MTIYEYSTCFPISFGELYPNQFLSPKNVYFKRKIKLSRVLDKVVSGDDFANVLCHRLQYVQNT